MDESSANGKDLRLTQQAHSASEGASNNKGRNLEVHILLLTYLLCEVDKNSHTIGWHS
jgi:hypothetical protein